MSRVSCRGGVLSVLSCLLLLLPAAGRVLAAKEGEDVQFETADKVELHGTFYAAGKANAPCVVLLHKFGGKRDDPGWQDLAQQLSGTFAVLSFDFRGHGESTKVDPILFWSVPQNRAAVRGGQGKPEISVARKDFGLGYLPAFVNDIEAAKRYLDQQNDAGACNSSNIILIGAEEGAAVGAGWINYEYQTHHPKLNPIFNRWIHDPNGKIMGEDIAGAIWLSIPRSLGGIPMISLLRGPGNIVRDKVPMVFVYGKEDKRQADINTKLYQELLKASRTRIDLTAPLPKKAHLAGNLLLGKKGLNTEEEIGNYLERMMKKRAKKAPERHANEPPLQVIPVQRLGFGAGGGY